MGIRLALLCAAAFTLSGCGSAVERWIVDTRVHQGDVALERGSVTEAQLAYRLALRVDPSDPRARTGYAEAAAEEALREYRNGKLDDALSTISDASRYEPQSVRLAALRSEIEQAKIKREIVVANYPAYRETGAAIRRSYEQLKTMNANIVTDLLKFNYSYNINDLNRAIQQSYELNLEVARNTNRLVGFRQLVESGVPTPKAAQIAAPASLLPLP